MSEFRIKPKMLSIDRKMSINKPMIYSIGKCKVCGFAITRKELTVNYSICEPCYKEKKHGGDIEEGELF